MHTCLICGNFCGCSSHRRAAKNDDAGRSPFQFLGSEFYGSGCLPEHELRPAFYRGRRYSHMSDREIRFGGSRRSGCSSRVRARMNRESGLRFFGASPLKGGRAE